MKKTLLLMLAISMTSVTYAVSTRDLQPILDFSANVRLIQDWANTPMLEKDIAIHLIPTASSGSNGIISWYVLEKLNDKTYFQMELSDYSHNNVGISPHIRLEISILLRHEKVDAEGVSKGFYAPACEERLIYRDFNAMSILKSVHTEAYCAGQDGFMPGFLVKATP